MSAVPNLPENIAHLNGATKEYIVNGDLPINDQVNGVISGSHFKLHDTPIENFRPIKVIVIGAGYSGIYCGIRIPERIRNVELVIYDKNAGVGGTWYENKYPGCACDIPSHSYQFSFEPNHHWSSLYAPAQEIQAYLERTAKKFGADRFIKLSHQIVDCRYDEGQAKWHVRVKKLDTGEEFEDTSDVLISARGNLNNIAWPEIDGLRSFEGEIMHSAKWNNDYDFTNRRIGIIGTGSSAIQIVPSLQKLSGTQLSCFVRSKTWISPPFSADLWEKIGIPNSQITDEQKQKWASDPTVYQKFRLAIEEDGNAIHGVTIKGSPMQIAGQKAFTAHMRSKLAKKPEIFEALLPNFAPGCRRLTPGLGYLDALVEDNVVFVKDRIASIEPKGVRTVDGKLHEIDALVCATGFHTSAPPPFRVAGIGGTTIQDRWRERATTYLSLAVDGFPNHFMMLGPNAAIGSGSLTMMIESVGDYIVRCVRKIQKENIRSMTVAPGRVRDFADYVDAYFAKTVFMDECKSWYRKGDKITGLWPGSTLHCIETMRSPRWEDYEYEYVDDGAEGETNRLGWLGNGWTTKQLEGKDLAWYLYPEFQEVPLPGRPEENERYKIKPFSY